MAAVARESPREPGKVAGRSVTPLLAIGVATVDVDEQSRQRADVLVVVPNHVDERPRLTPAEVVEIPARDLPASNVCSPVQPEELGLDRSQPRIAHPVAEHTADEGQQVEMPRVERRVPAGHPVPGDEQRPVEAAAVVRHEPAVIGDARSELRQQRRLVGVIREEELDLPKAAALPPAEADEERQGSGRGREPGRLGVEAEEGSIRRWLPGERRESVAIDGQDRARRLDTNERSVRGTDQLAVDRSRKPLRAD